MGPLIPKGFLGQQGARLPVTPNLAGGNPISVFRRPPWSLRNLCKSPWPPRFCFCFSCLPFILPLGMGGDYSLDWGRTQFGLFFFNPSGLFVLSIPASAEPGLHWPLPRRQISAPLPLCSLLLPHPEGGGKAGLGIRIPRAVFSSNSHFTTLSFKIFINI